MNPLTASVVIHVLGEDGFEVAAPGDEEPVQALAADGADEPLGDSGLSGPSWWQLRMTFSAPTGSSESQQ